MTNDDDDIHAALAEAHEPAPPFDSITNRRRSRSMRVRFALAGIAAIVVAIFAWPAKQHSESLEAHLDLRSPAMSSTRLALPLDSLLDVPGLDVLDTTPTLVTGGLP